MMLATVCRDYQTAIIDTDRDQAMQIVHDAFSGGISAEDIVFRVVIPSIERLISDISSNPGSLAQHYICSQIAAEVVDEMIPHFVQTPESIGHVVIGTSPGDFHALGKRIVIGCLKARMIGITDLGMNVSPETFVDAALENGAQVIAISSMMIHTARGEKGCRAVRRILSERNLEDAIKIVVGGAPYRFDKSLYLRVGADAWAENGILAGDVITSLIREVKP